MSNEGFILVEKWAIRPYSGAFNANSTLQSIDCSLRRMPSISNNTLPKWGLTLTLIDTTHLIIANVNNSRFKDFNGPLSPGDSIIFIDGMPMNKFQNLKDVTSYLSTALNVRISLLRHPSAQLAARLQLNLGATGRIPLQIGATRAAAASYKSIVNAIRLDQYYTSTTYATQQSFTYATMKSRLPSSLYQRPGEFQRDHRVNCGEKTITVPKRSNQQVLQRNQTLKVHPEGEKHNDYESEKSIFLSQVKDFDVWLNARKRKWRQNWNVMKKNYKVVSHSTSDLSESSVFNMNDFHPDLRKLSNNLFQCDFDDNLDDAWGQQSRVSEFLPKIKPFSRWLQDRKQTWRRKWDFDVCTDDNSSIIRPAEFWLMRGYSTFQNWLSDETTRWRRSFSWQLRKRKRMEMESSVEVHFPSDVVDERAGEQFLKWLAVRRNQWRIARRKRQRKILKLEERAHRLVSDETSHIVEVCSENCQPNYEAPINVFSDGIGLPQTKTSKEMESTCSVQQSQLNGETKFVDEHEGPIFRTVTDPELLHIDALIEEEERKEREVKERFSDQEEPLDLFFLFDAAMGCPDDIVADIIRYLPVSEHGRLLCINYVSSEALKKRSNMWRSLCPSHWILPTRLRKSWASLYITNLRGEEEATTKVSDDILTKAAKIMSIRDDLLKLEKLVAQAEKKLIRFSINYVSAVVLERSSLLNLAVMKKRHKISKWLVERGADIETRDRGGFTPLLNAAYVGDKAMVRYLLSKGSNRHKVGTEHSTQALAHISFKGHTAEDWARKRGYVDVADLIKYGI